MRFGIDLGTSRTVVAQADRGNYPVIQFQSGQGQWLPWFPSLICMEGGVLRCGFNAEKVIPKPSVFVLPSFKRLLRVTSPHQEIPINEDHGIGMLNLLSAFCSSLKSAILLSSNLQPTEDLLEVMIAVPAHANSNQRYLTLEAFRRAGFSVIGMVNEPSAAGIEYTHQYMKLAKKKGQREYLAIYDWGAGTFDAAVIRIADFSHEVLANQGISQLGGDDLDEIMLSMALEAGALPQPDSTGSLTMLLRECREAKERLRPHSKKIMLDFSTVYPDSEILSLPVADFYKRTQPLVAETLSVLEDILQQTNEIRPSTEDGRMQNLAAIYLVGGSSNFPQIEWCLRDCYGRRIQKSPYAHASTAIGLAILADTQSGFQLQEKVSRHFGVWREDQCGGDKVFDLIFPKDLLKQKPGEILHATRSYHPSHNIGHFRFLECTSLGANGQPQGNITLWEEIFFPFDPAFKTRRVFSPDEIVRYDRCQDSLIEEVYSCDNSGIIRVEVFNRTADYSRIFPLKPVLR